MDLDHVPLRVALMLESEGMGGAEIMLFDLAAELRERGHRLIAIVSELPGSSSAPSWLGEKFRESGFQTYTYHRRHTLEVGEIWKLRRLLCEHDIDVLHGHEFDGVVYGAASSTIAGRACVATLHGNQTMTESWHHRAALRWAFRRCSAVTAVSQVTKQQLDRDLGCDPDVISVIRNGVPIRRGDATSVRRELGIRAGEQLILAVGNLIHRKGHIILLQALQHLRSRPTDIPPWRLAIAGGGAMDQRQHLEIFAQKHGFADRVHILSQRGDIPDLQAAASIFAMPSLWEGLPLAILEAMLAGTAIVASGVSGIPEAIDDQIHGLLVPPANVEALANALTRLLTDPVLRADLANRARERAEREFTIAAMADAYENLYRSAAAIAPKGNRPRSGNDRLRHEL